MTKNSTALFTTIASSIPKLSLAALLVFTLGKPAWSQAKTVEIIRKPTVNEDKITVPIKVKDDNGKAVMGLEATNFDLLVDNKPLKFNSKDWKSPDETIPPPAFIIVLLDYSGSMNEKDSSGTTKIEGAIKAIRQFKDELANRCPKNSTVPCPQPQISIVPFGDPGGDCPGNPVDDAALDKLFPAGDFKLTNYLDNLAKIKPCASTNIYEPLTKAIKFLANEADPRFAVPPADSKLPEPRLSIVLLSDGYHNKPNEERDFKNLLTLMKRNDRIIVHTLGYGLTPAKLGEKYKLGRPATRADLVAKPPEGTPMPEGKVPEEEFVEESRLAEIATTTGGIGEFSPDAATVSEKLKLFLNALLGEYQISYVQPNAERGSKHDVAVIVRSNSPDVQSATAPYTIAVFGRSLPWQARMIMMLLVLAVLILGGVLPFWFWGQHLKQEAEGS